MAVDKRERAMENLAVASVLGFLAFIVGALSFAADSNSIAVERAAFDQDGRVVVLAGHADDPAFDRVFRIQSDSSLAFGAVLTFRSPQGSALVGALFSPDGDLLELRLLGSCASRLPEKAQDLIGAFPGAGEALARAADRVRYLSRASRGAES